MMAVTTGFTSRVMTRVPPYFLAGVGVLADVLTTLLGLSRGFIEAHPNFNPLVALLVFWAVIFTAEWSSSGRHKHLVLAVSSIAFIGAIHNTLVLCGFTF